MILPRRRACSFEARRRTPIATSSDLSGYEDTLDVVRRTSPESQPRVPVLKARYGELSKETNMASEIVPHLLPPQRRITRMFGNQRVWAPYLFIAPFFLTFAVFTLYPLVWGAVIAFQESLGYSNQWEWVGPTNFQEALTDDSKVRIALRNAALFAVGSIVMQLPVALPGVTIGVIGRWFFQRDRGFANALLTALGGERIDWSALPQFIIPIMLLMAFWQYVGSHTVFFIAGISGIDTVVVEAAIVDGANVWQRFYYIILPLLKPVVLYVLITMTSGSLMIYETAVLTQGAGGPFGQGWFFIPYITTLAFSLFRLGYATAVGWIVFAIAVALALIQVRLFKFGEIR
jgi:ABC-type sugar transport system permease subunit